MSHILILGNGISRLSNKAQHFIEHWEGEIWGCNRIYQDYGDRISLLAGHQYVLDMAEESKKETGFTFKTLNYRDSKMCGTGWSHSGVFLCALALEDGFDVVVCGFDLGGLDIYVPNHEKQQKDMWVRKWRELLAHYGSDRVTFFGHDHKKYLLSNENRNKYYQNYHRGRVHIHTIDYIDTYNHFVNQRGIDPNYRGHLLLDRSKIMEEAMSIFKKKDGATPIEELGQTPGGASVDGTGSIGAEGQDAALDPSTDDVDETGSDPTDQDDEDQSGEQDAAEADPVEESESPRAIKRAQQAGINERKLHGS